jgi:hypothetical protein
MLHCSVGRRAVFYCTISLHKITARALSAGAAITRRGLMQGDPDGRSVDPLSTLPGKTANDTTPECHQPSRVF